MKPSILPALVLASLLGACSAGSGDGPTSKPEGAPPTGAGNPAAPGGSPGSVPGVPDTLDDPGTLDDPDRPVLDPTTSGARYRVTLSNLWGAEDYPQEFPDDAHLSLVGGALHTEDTVFWAFGEPLSRGMEDLAETGRIDILLYDEVVPAIEAGEASSYVEYRTYTGPMIDGQPGTSEFEIEAEAGFERLTLATMLGPSPDWFVGVSGLALDDANGWQARIEVDLPLLDGGSKSDIIPTMGGPSIRPPEPVGYVAYDPATGTYLPSAEPQIMARLTLMRIR